ncbi:type II toxin-antitoxin system RelE/ParE family toxin [Vibrio sp. 2026]|jgi:plasmid stabilization system protein ParE|uniref:type II toxin-antitoxin system RelE/ParE family toxin n=1 Tax=Gammaproteobacteria TaxID=1236 RepID=UPI000E93E295|nr:MULTISPECIES: type II toxin-antitoxin system RelE/ParE family toxin [unclassified Vibrio]MDG2840293.1 type II toxin-antitoxin system RelE/ParE family toxin [Vibrio parahaemolyticus]NWN89835.1 type II toxin-antitoxin system RelE/ParE family toxin [Micrococcaceae bacterium]NWO06584.1 type II toxin-antitoxin system RelE/ParE family toxin [Alteromonadaceae bacterium]HBX40808.1 plasmid stabilization protein [Marinobacter adhaerens]MDW2034944.1 type II toxin-antitoxin system RelE/ParE family toxi
MSQVIFAPAAIRDLERLREFLRPKNPTAAERAAKAIIQGVQALGELPRIGRPIEDMPEEFRDWLIDFGDSGYVARYRIDGDTVVVLAIRHQKEAGF